jgi:hypothetical protein
MTKKRSRKKRKRRQQKAQAQRTPKDSPVAKEAASSTAQRVGQRIAAAGADYLQDNFIRIMQGNAVLRQEPEFADLYFEPRQALEASVRHFPRLRRQLTRAARRGMEATATTYDDYRIAVLDDLGTPQFRHHLRQRLEQCIDRLKRGHDAEKFEMALFLSALLGDKASDVVRDKGALPLGVYSLVTTIYEDSFDRAMGEIDDARDIVGEDLYNVWCAKHNKKDMEAIAAATEQSSAFEELTLLTEAEPALALAWERQERYLLEGLESRITHLALTFSPGLFTAGEVALTMDKMERRHLSKPWSPSRYLAAVAMANFALCIRETLDEIVSPQRMVDMLEPFKAVGQKSLESKEDRIRALVPYIQAAIRHLQREKTPSRNRVVRMMYVSAFATALRDGDALSPRWQRLVRRLEKSRLLWKISEAAD